MEKAALGKSEGQTSGAPKIERSSEYPRKDVGSSDVAEVSKESSVDMEQTPVSGHEVLSVAG